MDNKEAKIYWEKFRSEIPKLIGYVDAAIEALDKQIPKKPVGTIESPEEVGKIGYHHCPNCNYIVTGRHCSYCGQRIDWSEDNE